MLTTIIRVALYHCCCWLLITTNYWKCPSPINTVAATSSSTCTGTTAFTSTSTSFVFSARQATSITRVTNNSKNHNDHNHIPLPIPITSIAPSSNKIHEKIQIHQSIISRYRHTRRNMNMGDDNDDVKRRKQSKSLQNDIENLIKKYIQQEKLSRSEMDWNRLIQQSFSHCIKSGSINASFHLIEECLEIYIQEKRKRVSRNMDAISHPNAYVIAILRNKIKEKGLLYQNDPSSRQAVASPKEQRQSFPIKTSSSPPLYTQQAQRNINKNPIPPTSKTLKTLPTTQKDQGTNSSSNNQVTMEKVNKCLSLICKLEEPITSLKGIGPATASLFHKMNLYTIRSLLWHFPTSFIDRSKLINDVSTISLDDVGSDDSTVITAILTVDSFDWSNPIMFKANCYDSAGNRISLLYFHGGSPAGRRKVGFAAQSSLGKPGSQRIVSGKLKRTRSRGDKEKSDMRKDRVTANKVSDAWDIIQPDIVKPVKDLESVQRVEPVYRLTQGLTQRKVASAIQEALDLVFQLLDELPVQNLLHSSLVLSPELSWPEQLKDALVYSHRPPKSKGDSAKLLSRSSARMCVAFHELCIQQVHLGLTRWRYKNPYNHQIDTTVKTTIESESNRNSPETDTMPRMILKKAPSTWKDSPLVAMGLAGLPFELTKGQETCLTESWSDALTFSNKKKPARMARLLQGDVGCGKTVVAFLLALGCMESPNLSNVVTLLAPTKILANQHTRTINEFVLGLQHNRKFFEDNMSTTIQKIHVELLTGDMRETKKEELLRRLEQCPKNEAFFVIGTHALLTQQAVSIFSQLHRPTQSVGTLRTQSQGIALAIIDEEQRFGVEQREKLCSCAWHSMYMSATPIPRTLALGGSFASSTGFSSGSLDLSTIESKPSSAKKVKTSIVDIDRVDEVIQGIERQILKGSKILWILPLIGNETEAEVVEVSHVQKDMNVIERHKSLSNILGGDRIGMVHGRMNPSERDIQIERFSSQDSEVSVLVGTSVLEVGIDIPNANIIIIERAERFGLSQLHQLRGRIGRATQEKNEDSLDCHCVLLTDAYQRKGTKSSAVKRFEVLRNTNDGSKIAQADLALRGIGEILGLRQSGMKIGLTIDIESHLGLVSIASKIGRSISKGSSLLSYNDANFEDSVVDTAYEYSGSYEGKMIETFYFEQQVNLPLSSSMLASSKNGLTLRVLLCLFGQWTYETKEGSCRLALGTLKSMTQPIESSLDAAINDSFTGLYYQINKHTDQSLLERAQINGKDRIKTKLKRNDNECIATTVKIEKKPSLLHDDVAFLVVDTETTGVSKNSHVIQLAAKLLGSNETFSAYILPPYPISAKIEKLTGITNSFLHDGGICPATGDFYPPARSFPCAYQELQQFCNSQAKGRPLVLIAHNANFDLRMLNNELKRLTSTLRKNGCKEDEIPMLGRDTGIIASIDTLKLFRDRNLWKPMSSYPQSFGLEAIHSHLFPDTVVNSHNAVNDILTLEEILSSPLIVESKWKAIADKMLTSLPIANDITTKATTLPPIKRKSE